MAEEVDAAVVALLRARLKKLEWSQLEFATAIGVTAGVVSRWLSGERTPSLDMAFRIQRSKVAIPADAWVSHSADESGELTAVTSSDSGTEG